MVYVKDAVNIIEREGTNAEVLVGERHTNQTAL